MRPPRVQHFTEKIFYKHVAWIRDGNDTPSLGWTSDIGYTPHTHTRIHAYTHTHTRAARKRRHEQAKAL